MALRRAAYSRSKASPFRMKVILRRKGNVEVRVLNEAIQSIEWTFAHSQKETSGLPAANILKSGEKCIEKIFCLGQTLLRTQACSNLGNEELPTHAVFCRKIRDVLNTKEAQPTTIRNALAQILNQSLWMIELELFRPSPVVTFPQQLREVELRILLQESGIWSIRKFFTLQATLTTLKSAAYSKASQPPIASPPPLIRTQESFGTANHNNYEIAPYRTLQPAQFEEFLALYVTSTETWVPTTGCLERLKSVVSGSLGPLHATRMSKKPRPGTRRYKHDNTSGDKEIKINLSFYRIFAYPHLGVNDFARPYRTAKASQGCTKFRESIVVAIKPLNLRSDDHGFTSDLVLGILFDDTSIWVAKHLLSLASGQKSL
ncbi:uncharacterized protein BDR25DRAFT_356318 [Lindgomyces ingoldianus]|uniref:Uncharacterized protein n=1 Tax=Lindgomyces ingoldianus TaxID=673940 RepID=A0ACB6QRH7_9PLEO|nr:uncharacterized protein BDR25DRAFT_356318 [Lindgomyces ingoldianus]KAF2469589.1 hypothetical protein BDR25DRAFT_356318 [Lindgomyces ingoldianus]